jgi:hypothetical protein
LTVPEIVADVICARPLEAIARMKTAMRNALMLALRSVVTEADDRS